MFISLALMCMVVMYKISIEDVYIQAEVKTNIPSIYLRRIEDKHCIKKDKQSAIYKSQMYGLLSILFVITKKESLNQNLVN